MTNFPSESEIAVAAMNAEADAHDAGVDFSPVNFEAGYCTGYEAATSKWLDISSAPKSGDILAYCKNTDEQFIVWWSEQTETGRGGWVAFSKAGGICVLIKDLSHWMPLPSPPRNPREGG